MDDLYDFSILVGYFTCSCGFKSENMREMAVHVEQFGYSREHKVTATVLDGSSLKERSDE